MPQIGDYLFISWNQMGQMWKARIDGTASLYYVLVVIRVGISAGSESDYLNNMCLWHVHIVSVASTVASLFVLEDVKILHNSITAQESKD